MATGDERIDDSAGSRKEQRGSFHAIACIGVGAVREQHFAQGGVACFGRNMQGGSAARRARLHIKPASDQQRRDVAFKTGIAPGEIVKQSLAVLDRCLNIGATSDQGFGERKIPSQIKRCLAVLVARFDIGAASEEKIGGGNLARRGRTRQSAPAILIRRVDFCAAFDKRLQLRQVTPRRSFVKGQSDRRFSW